MEIVNEMNMRLEAISETNMEKKCIRTKLPMLLNF